TLERRLKEEEDARIHLEEQRRLEEERKQREEEERKRCEEEAKNRAAELVRLADEYASSLSGIEAKASRLEADLRRRKDQYDVRRTFPDASVENDINAFLHSWTQDTNYSDVNLAAQSCDAARLVVQDLLYLHMEARALHREPQLNRTAMYLHKLMTLTTEKLDATTAHMLQYADEFLDPSGKGEVRVAAAAGPIKVGLWMNLVPKGLRNKKIDFSELGATVDVPKPVVMQTLAVRVCYLPYDVATQTALQNVDAPLGGVFGLDLLKIPAAPKGARGWTMRELSTETNVRLEYPLEGSVATASLAVKVTLLLPADVLYPANPRVAWWDPVTQSWLDDGISEILLVEETNMLYFNTMKLTHLAVVQRRNVHHVKHFWTMKTTVIDDGSAFTAGATAAVQLVLRNAMYNTIHFEVTDVGVRLVAPAVPALAALNAAYLSPEELLTRLGTAGMDLTPTEVDDKRFDVVPKLAVLEKHLIAQVLGLVAAFEMKSLSGDEDEVSPQWERWSDSPRYAVFCVKEVVWPWLNQADDVDDVGEFIHVLAEVDEETAAEVKFRTNATLSVNNPFDTYVHLRHALATLSTPDAKDRMDNSNLLLEVNLQKFLALLRLFSYTKPPKRRVVEARGRMVTNKDQLPLASAEAMDPAEMATSQ
ncbi:hypothetical protein B5M09_013015, partial [Aphanomyces astaci]